jgi:hypothetical protein
MPGSGKGCSRCSVFEVAIPPYCPLRSPRTSTPKVHHTNTILHTGPLYSRTALGTGSPSWGGPDTLLSGSAKRRGSSPLSHVWGEEPETLLSAEPSCVGVGDRVSASSGVAGRPGTRVRCSCGRFGRRSQPGSIEMGSASSASGSIIVMGRARRTPHTSCSSRRFGAQKTTIGLWTLLARIMRWLYTVKQADSKSSYTAS